MTFSGVVTYKNMGTCLCKISFLSKLYMREVKKCIYTTPYERETRLLCDMPASNVRQRAREASSHVKPITHWAGPPSTPRVPNDASLVEPERWIAAALVNGEMSMDVIINQPPRMYCDPRARGAAIPQSSF